MGFNSTMGNNKGSTEFHKTSVESFKHENIYGTYDTAGNIDSYNDVYTFGDFIFRSFDDRSTEESLKDKSDGLVEGIVDVKTI